MGGGDVECFGACRRCVEAVGGVALRSGSSLEIWGGVRPLGIPRRDTGISSSDAHHETCVCRVGPPDRHEEDVMEPVRSFLGSNVGPTRPASPRI